MTESTSTHRLLFFCTAALLDQGRTVDRLSRPLTAAALIGILLYPAMMTTVPRVTSGAVVVVALAGLFEIYFAIRVGFDAALLRQLATASEGTDFSGIDGALTRLDLLPAAKHGRPVEARVTGARRLFRRQVFFLVIQGLAILASGCAAWTWR